MQAKFLQVMCLKSETCGSSSCLLYSFCQIHQDRGDGTEEKRMSLYEDAGNWHERGAEWRKKMRERESVCVRACARVCVYVCVREKEVKGGRRRYHISSLPLYPLCCLLVLSVLGTSKLNLSWDGVNSGWGGGWGGGGVGGLVVKWRIWRETSSGSSRGPWSAEFSALMTSQMQSEIGPWASLCVCVCVLVCVCVYVCARRSCYHWDKHSIASAGPSGQTQSTLPVCSLSTQRIDLSLLCKLTHQEEHVAL